MFFSRSADRPTLSGAAVGRGWPGAAPFWPETATVLSFTHPVIIAIAKAAKTKSPVNVRFFFTTLLLFL